MVSDMNETRRQKRLREITPLQLDLASFLETYDLTFSAPSATIREGLVVLGGTPFKGAGITSNFSSGKVDFKIDPSQLGIDESLMRANPQEAQRRLEVWGQSMLKEHLKNLFAQVTLYRFTIAEVHAQEVKLPDIAAAGPAGYLTDGFHPWKLLRLYGAYQ